MTLVEFFQRLVWFLTSPAGDRIFSVVGVVLLLVILCAFILSWLDDIFREKS